MQLQLVIIGALAMTAMAQRSSFAGSRGNGYKDGLLQNKPLNNDNNNNIIENRNGDGGSSARIPSNEFNPNQNLPIDALGDTYLVNHYNGVPVDHQPFWFLNQHHIEAHRGTPKRPSTASTIDSRIQPNQFNSLDFPTRFNADAAGFAASNNFNNQPIGSNQNSPSDIVYPINTTPDQRIAMEIQFLQQRLNSLSQIRNQLQQQNQYQSN